MHVFVDGASTELRETEFLGSSLLDRDSAAEELPYLFCGNGACRDCNLLVEGIEHVPGCRIPCAPGISVRRGEGAGEENALARRLLRAEVGAPLTADAVVVGGGVEGRTAALELRRRGVEPLVLEARSGAEGRPRPVAVVAGIPLVYEEGEARPIEAGAFVLATGRRDTYPYFPGATLPGVLPLDLLERYVALGAPRGGRLVLAGELERVERLAARLEARKVEAVAVVTPGRLEGASGERRLERVRLRGGPTLAADILAVSFRREPAISIARALGCRTRYDREARVERLVLGADGATSVEGVFAAPPGGRAGAAAARFLESSGAKVLEWCPP